MTKSKALGQNIKTLIPFISSAQLKVMVDATKGEEGEYFCEKFQEYADRVASMAKTYETDGQGNKAIVALHYFLRDSDWYIIERDVELEQLQAFGFAILNGDTQYAELGYIPICEITRYGAELDIHWTPKPLGVVKSAFSN